MSGLVPEGDVRLSINMNKDLHLKLKIAAAEGRTTIGEIIEGLAAMHFEKESQTTVKVGNDFYRQQSVWVKV